MTNNPSWTAGAHSMEPLEGDGWFSFAVPVGASGVSVGLVQDDKSEDPDEPLLGFVFGSGTYKLVERGVARSTAVLYSDGQVFHLARHADTFYYCIGSTPVHVPGVPFALPGTVLRTVHANALDWVPPAGRAWAPGLEAWTTGAPLFLDAALLAGGDEVRDASLTLIGAGCQVALEPLQVSASEGSGAGVSVEFLAPQVVADNGQGADLSMLAPQVRASQVQHHAAVLRFEPMTARAVYGPPTLQGVDVSLQYPVASGSGPGTAAVDIVSHPLLVSAADAAFSEGFVFLPPMRVRSAGHASGGPKFDGEFARLSGDLPAPMDAVDGAWASDGASAQRYVLAQSTAVAGDAAWGSVQVQAACADEAMAGDMVRLSAIVVVSDVALASDAASADADVLAVDGALAGDAAAAQSDAWVLVGDAALAGDAAAPFLLVEVQDAAAAGDAVEIAASAWVEDGAQAGDTASVQSWATVLWVQDGAEAGDGALHTTVAVADVQDAALAGDDLLMKQPGLVAWVMNADTGAVSWYGNWAFTDMAVVGGKVFASGPDGLVVLGGDADGSDAIDARVEYGFSEFGGYHQDGSPKPSEPKKRLPSLWFGYHAAGALRATVETYGQGYGVYRYAMEPRAARQPRNNRIQVGKGLNSRYWRIGVENACGCAFEVHSISAEIATSSRRL